MRKSLFLILFALAGCGADGEPLAPHDTPAPAALSVSGEAAVGVTL